MKIKISEYCLYINKTVYYEVSCGIVVGRVLKATVDRCLDPAGALCELPPKLTAKGPHERPLFDNDWQLLQFCPMLAFDG